MNNELAKALNEFQAEVVTVGKDGTNPHFRSSFASLSNIMQSTQPILTRHGLSVMQLLDNLDGQPALTTIVYHVSGQSERSTIPLILAKNDPQGVGSAVTYMRRYGYAAALQIVIDEDDDGNRASYQKPAQTASTAATRPGTQGHATDKQRAEVQRLLKLRDFTTVEQQKKWLSDNGIAMPLTVQGASQALAILNQPSSTRG